jgi:hypothetical protein
MSTGPGKILECAEVRVNVCEATQNLHPIVPRTGSDPFQ